MPAEFPLPPAQRAFLEPVYRRNSLLSLSFGRSLDHARFRVAWHTLVRIHPVLRSSFEGSTLCEHEIGETALPNWEETDWSAEDPANIGELWQELQEKAAADFFGEGSHPLWRIFLIKLPGGQSHLLAAFHPALLDQKSASTLLIQWLNAYEAEPDLLATLPAMPGLAVANASVDVAETQGSLWPENWQGNIALELLSPWHWLSPSGGQTATGEDSPQPHVIANKVPGELIDALRSSAEHCQAAPQELFSLLWAGFWAARSEVRGSLTGHPFDLTGHLAPEHHDILGRLTPIAPFAMRKAPPEGSPWPFEWWKEQLPALRQAGGHIFSQPPPSLNVMVLESGLPATGKYPGSAAFWNEEAINDFLHTHLPRWLSADAKWTEYPALPVSVFLQGGRHPEMVLVAHPGHMDSSTCTNLLADFLRFAGGAFDLPEALFDLVRKTRDPGAGAGSLFSLSSEPSLSDRLGETLAAHASRPILHMGENAMSGADLLGCSNQLARYLRRGKLPEGTRYLVNLQPGNWLSLVLLTLVREGLPFLFCEELVPADQDAAWFEKEKIGCVFLDSVTSAGWEEAGHKKIIVDTVWEKIAAMSDAALQSRKGSGPVSWEFGSVDGVRRQRLGEALLGSFLETAVAFWQLDEDSRILSTAMQGSPAWLEETLVASVSGASLVHPGEDIFATRSAFQEALQALQITHLALPAIRWSDWVHFLVELRQAVPGTLRRVLLRAGRMGIKAQREWLHLCGENLNTAVYFSPFSLTAPGLGAEIEQDFLPLLEQGLIPLGRPLGETECHAVAADGTLLPAGSPGELRMSLPASAVVDGIAASDLSLGLRGLLHPCGLYCALSQPDVTEASWSRPPAPVSAAAENALQSREEIFDAFVVRRAEGVSAGPVLQAWLVPQESGASVPVDLGAWWKRQDACAWKLEAASPIAKCPVRNDGSLDTGALPPPTALASTTAASSPKSGLRGSSATPGDASCAEKHPVTWDLQWLTKPKNKEPSLLIYGAFPFSNFADTLAAEGREEFAAAALSTLPTGQLPPDSATKPVFLAAGVDTWELLRWLNSLETEARKSVQVLILQPALGEGSQTMETKLKSIKSLWSKMLGKGTPGNARREGVRGVRPVRCREPIRVLCSDEPEEALVSLLPEAEFFTGDLSSVGSAASAILDILRDETEELPVEETAS